MQVILQLVHVNSFPLSKYKNYQSIIFWPEIRSTQVKVPINKILNYVSEKEEIYLSKTDALLTTGGSGSVALFQWRAEVW